MWIWKAQFIHKSLLAPKSIVNKKKISIHLVYLDKREGIVFRDLQSAWVEDQLRVLLMNIAPSP
jgi:hypothetical protein